MTSLVIGDLHHYVSWVLPFVKALKKIRPIDEIIQIGDCQDDFKDTPKKAEATAKWVKARLDGEDDEKWILLVGNHDLPYMLKVWNGAYNCPGYDIKKKEAIDKVLAHEDWDKIVPAYYTQGFLISHAGFSYNLIAHPVLGVPKPEELVQQATEGLREARNGNHNKFFLPGWRMCEPFIGGITWSDWNNEYIPVCGIPQIVGHTPGSYIRAKRVTSEQTDYCIDCLPGAVLIIEDGEIEVLRVKSVK